MADSSTERAPDPSDQTAKVGVRRGPEAWTALQWLLALALLYSVYLAKSLLMPIVVAVLFSLLLSPMVKLFKRFRVPRPVSAVLLIAVLGGPFILLSIELAAPIQKWVARVPELSAQLTEQLDVIGKQFSPEPEVEPAPPPPEEKGFSFFDWFKDDKPPEPAPVAEPESESALVEGVKKNSVEVIIAAVAAAPAIVGQFLIWIVLVLFLLIYGPGLYDTFINLSPLVRDKRRAVLLVGRLRRELSRYILTVSVINLGLGLVTGYSLWLLGVEDAVLWGAVVGLLNFAPFVGPVVSIGILVIAGVVQYGIELAAVVPAMTYFIINLVESQVVTPIVLGQNMRLNPLVLIIWLTVWGWLWGAIGVLLAVPLLVCLKLVAAQLNILPSWVALIESRN